MTPITTLSDRVWSMVYDLMEEEVTTREAAEIARKTAVCFEGVMIHKERETE